jgi:hypothetical protein
MVLRTCDVWCWSGLSERAPVQQVQGPEFKP